MLTLNIIPLPNPEVVGRIVDDEAVLVLPGKGKVTVLNEVGGRIWSLINGQRSIKDIAGDICREFKVSQSDAERDTLIFLQQLWDKEIITIGG